MTKSIHKLYTFYFQKVFFRHVRRVRVPYTINHLSQQPQLLCVKNNAFSILNSAQRSNQSHEAAIPLYHANIVV